MSLPLQRLVDVLRIEEFQLTDVTSHLSQLLDVTLTAMEDDNHFPRLPIVADPAVELSANLSFRDRSGMTKEIILMIIFATLELGVVVSFGVLADDIVVRLIPQLLIGYRSPEPNRQADLQDWLFSRAAIRIEVGFNVYCDKDQLGPTLEGL